MKSIKIKMVIYIGALLLISCLGLQTISYLSASKAITAQTDEALEHMAEQSANVVSQRLNVVLGTLETVALMDILTDTEVSKEEKSKVLQDETKR